MKRMGKVSRKEIDEPSRGIYFLKRQCQQGKTEQPRKGTHILEQ